MIKIEVNKGKVKELEIHGDKLTVKAELSALIQSFLNNDKDYAESLYLALAKTQDKEKVIKDLVETYEKVEMLDKPPLFAFLKFLGELADSIKEDNDNE